MSSDILNFLEDDLRGVAEQHLQHDLTQTDRDTLEASASKIYKFKRVGIVLGLGLSVILVHRSRSTRLEAFNAFRATRKPTHPNFVNGHKEIAPEVKIPLRPTVQGGIILYTLFGMTGIIFGRIAGMLWGTYAAKAMISEDPGTKARVEKAIRGFQADILKRRSDILKRQAELLDSKKGASNVPSEDSNSLSDR